MSIVQRLAGTLPARLVTALTVLSLVGFGGLVACDDGSSGTPSGFSGPFGSGTGLDSASGTAATATSTTTAATTTTGTGTPPPPTGTTATSTTFGTGTSTTGTTAPMSSSSSTGVVTVGPKVFPGLYTRCTESAQCPMGTTCAVVDTQGFCTVECVESAYCPPPETGNAMTSCFAADPTSVCVLYCPTMTETCPTGLSCQPSTKTPYCN